MEDKNKDQDKSLLGRIRREENLGKPVEGQEPSGTLKTEAKEPTNLTTDLGNTASSGTGIQAGFYHEGEEQEALNSFYKPTNKKRAPGLIQKAVRKRSKLIFATIGGGGAIAIIGILLVFVSSLIIPDFAAHILEYQFVRTSRMFNQDTEEIASEKAALDSVDASTNAQLKDEFATTQSTLWDKFSNLSPNNVIDNLKSSEALQYNYTRTGVLQRPQLTSLTVNGETVDVSQLTASNFTKVLHPTQYFNPVSNFKTNVQVAQDVSTGLEDALRQDVGVIIRGFVENQIRQELGIGLIAWVVGKYKGKSAADAELQQQRDAYSEIDSGPPESSIVSPLENAIQDGNNVEKTDVANDKTLTEIDNNQGDDPNVDAAVANDLNTGILGDVAGAVDPFYSVALPVCIIYDGSLNSSSAQQTIDAQTAEDQRSFYLVQSGADQQKAGDTTGEAVGALAYKLGNISDSNTEIRAGGGTINTASNSIYPETSPGGDYSVVNAILPSIPASLINNIATNICPAITNVWVATGVGIANIIVGLFTGEGSTAAEEGAGEAASSALSKAWTNLISRFAIDDAINGTLARGYAYSAKVLEVFGINKSLLTTSAKIAGITELARLITYTKMNDVHNGLGVGTDFANQADAGGNLNANQVNQQEFYGAPLNNQQVAENSAADQNFLIAQNKSKSFVDRYFSFANPDSLVSRIGVDIASTINRSFFANIFSNIGKVFNPFYLFKNLHFGSAFAAGATDSDNYGNVQWGQTTDETNLVSNDPSYQPLENEEILNNSGQLNYIQSTYSKCYTDSMGMLLTGSDNGGNPEIQRDPNTGDITGGMCTEQYLGPNSIDANAKDSTNGRNDLIFRWRLEQSYNSTMDQLLGVQNATP